MAVDEELALALVCAAVRETFEECGVLLAGPDEGSVVGDATVYHGAREQLASRELAFSDFLRSQRLVLRADLLRPWANWVTPAKGHRRRYDTDLFVAALPEGQQADDRTSEAVSAGWSLPAEAVEDFAEVARSCYRRHGRSWTRRRNSATPSTTSSPTTARSSQ